MSVGLCCGHGNNFICHCGGAQSAGYFEPLAFFGAIGGRHRAGAEVVAAVRLQAPARATGGWVRGITHRSTTTPVSTQTGAAHGARRLARSLPALLVETC